MKHLYLLLLLCSVGLLFAADRGQKTEPRPNKPLSKAEVLKLTGDWKGSKLSRDIRILWLYGPEDHGGGEHDYIRVKELFVPMLKTIPRVTVEEAYLFPSKEQFERADLMIQFLHLPDLTDQQLEHFQSFVNRGGGVVSIHESCIIRPLARAEKLAKCIGCSWKGNRDSHWGKFSHDHPLFLKTDHPAFKGLPGSVRLNDESYWSLLKREEVEVIGTIAPAKGNSGASFENVSGSRGARSEAFWTYSPGKGRVFGTTTGHYTYTYFDPIYRLLLLRGIAWCLHEDPAPFMPLVFHGITSEEGQVGTTDRMMNYRNRSK
ncbi:MAG: ThuA domain-containing protein [Verrucomicrobia bacterium]|nr:MAG: ThuA domain-containing protein [Verrucomicrobiota bacterium]